MPSRFVPELDEALRRRLGRRFGPAVASWLDALPPVLCELGERWQIELDSLVPRGSISVVIRCRTAERRPAVLKISPERRRVLDEAAALATWRTDHVPAVLAVDERVGALLIEAIEPGTPLAESSAYPKIQSIASLLRSLHARGTPVRAFPPVAEHVEIVSAWELYDAVLQHGVRTLDELDAYLVDHGLPVRDG